MENIPVNALDKGFKYSSTRLLQAILTSRKPIYPSKSSKSPSRSALNKSKCDFSILNLSKLNESRINDPRIKPTQDVRKRYNSLNILPNITATSWCIMEATSSH